MLFNSYIFVLCFLPLCLAGYFVLNRLGLKKGALLFLLGMSLWFYGSNTPKYLILITASVLINYGFYRLSCVLTGENARRWAKLAAVALNLGVLFYFKYYDFFAETVNSIFRSNWTLRHIILPLGISFFTFQQISFVVDSFNGEVKDCSLLDYACFVTFFPQLIAGPIVTHDELVPQLQDDAKKRFNFENFSRGVYIFSMGLAKKVLIADNLNTAVTMGYALIGAGDWATMNSTNCALVMLSYTLQMYFDFSGYSDMALGLGMMFGFHFRENFNYPYVSGSIKEFWRRWHMSLSGWFKEYLYIPLGGNRKGKFRTVINKMIVFLCTGIWHGASFNFLFWGAYHGFFLMLEEYVPFIGKKGGKVKSVFQHIYALLTVCIGFVFFRADTMKQGCFWIREMFTDFSWKTSAMSLTLQQLTPVYFITLAAALVAAVPVNQVLKKYKWYNGFTYVLSLAGFCLCILSLAGGTYNPFIYFRF